MQIIIAIIMLVLTLVLLVLGVKANKEDDKVQERISSLSERDSRKKPVASRKKQLESSFNSRVLFPLAQMIFDRTQAFIPLGSKSWVRMKAMQAGYHKPNFPKIFLGFQLLCTVVIFAMFFSFTALFGKVNGALGFRLEDGQEQGRAGHEVASVHVPAVEVGRDGRARPVDRRDPDLPAERHDRDANAGQELGTLTGPRDLGDPEIWIRELVGQQPEPRDVRGPAPAGRFELEQVDLEAIAGLGAHDGDRAVDLVDKVEVEVAEVFEGRVSRELAT